MDEYASNTKLLTVPKNPLFLSALVTTSVISVALVFYLGFGSMLKQIASSPERLRDIAFPIWDHYPLIRHGFLVFLSKDDFGKGIVYANHPPAYLFLMYCLYKLESIFPRLPMRGISPLFEMLFLVCATSYVALNQCKDKISLHQAILFLLAIACLITAPTFWTAVGKFNVDNAFPIITVLLLLLSYWISRSKIKGFTFWITVLLTSLINPICAAIFGLAVLLFSLSKGGFDRHVMFCAFKIVVIGIVCYLQPVLTAKALGFQLSNSTWLFRSGLDGDTRYFSNPINSILFPFYQRPFYLLLAPAILLTAQASILWKNREHQPIVDRQPHVMQFYALLFSEYVFTLLLWPQAISIHPYLYDIFLTVPLGICLVLNFAHFTILSKSAVMWIILMLFLLSFNLQQLAQSAACTACTYPSWSYTK